MMMMMMMVVVVVPARDTSGFAWWLGWVSDRWADHRWQDRGSRGKWSWWLGKLSTRSPRACNAGARKENAPSVIDKTVVGFSRGLLLPAWTPTSLTTGVFAARFGMEENSLGFPWNTINKPYGKGGLRTRTRTWSSLTLSRLPFLDSPFSTPLSTLLLPYLICTYVRFSFWIRCIMLQGWKPLRVRLKQRTA